MAKPNYIRGNFFSFGFRFWLALALTALILGSFLYFNFRGKAPVQYFIVARGDVISAVNVTGKVKPARSLDLAFERSGRIQKIYAGVGDRVKEGQALAQLDNGDISAQLLQAKASVRAEEATLSQLVAGTRIEDIQIKQSELVKAEQDLTNYYSSVPTILNDSYSKANDAVRQQADVMFTNSEQSNPQITFQTSAQIQIDVQSQRYAATIELNTWKNELRQLQSGTASSTFDQYLKNGEAHLDVIRAFLNKLSDALINPGNLSSATLTNYKTNLTNALTETNTAITNVLNQEQNIASGKATTAKLQNELNLELAGNEPQQIETQRAKVEQAAANAAYYQSQLERAILRAPFGGMVTRVLFDPGDIPGVGAPVVSLVGKGAYEIDANIAESDIAKVRVGETAKVTLDAYGSGIVWKAKVAQIDLSSTVIEGVATYKTTLRFNEEDSRILAGFTANIDILSDKRENALYLLSRNITTENDKKFVNLVLDPQRRIIRKIEIQTGLRGSDGKTEVIYGVREGDRVATE